MSTENVIKQMLQYARDGKPDADCLVPVDVVSTWAMELEITEAIRTQFKKIIPGLTSGTWEDIWERVRDKFKNSR